MIAATLTVKCPAGAHRVAVVRTEPTGDVVTVMHPGGQYRLDLTDTWATLAECACGANNLDSPALRTAIRNGRKVLALGYSPDGGDSDDVG